MSLISELKRRTFEVIAFLIVMFIAWRLKESPLLIYAMMMAAFLVALVFVPDSILEKIVQFLGKRR